MILEGGYCLSRRIGFFKALIFEKFRHTGPGSPTCTVSMSKSSTKGQLILNAIYGLVTSPKKRMDKFVFFAFLLFMANKSNLSIRFLGESAAGQSSFWFFLTFSKILGTYYLNSYRRSVNLESKLWSPRSWACFVSFLEESCFRDLLTFSWVWCVLNSY